MRSNEQIELVGDRLVPVLNSVLVDQRSPFLPDSLDEDGGDIFDGDGWGGTRGYAADEPERVVHRAFAVVSYDTDLIVDTTGIEWSTQLGPETLVRYYAIVNGGEWNETAQVSTDQGATLATTRKMHLRRTN